MIKRQIERKPHKPGQSCRNELPKLTVPAICIWGEDDHFAPVELGRQLEKMLPNVKFHYVAKAGHQVQNDQPAIVSKLMMDFLGAKALAKDI